MYILRLQNVRSADPVGRYGLLHRNPGGGHGVSLRVRNMQNDQENMTVQVDKLSGPRAFILGACHQVQQWDLGSSRGPRLLSLTYLT